MRLDIPDIYWHGPKDRILSLTFHPSGETLVTAGTVDSEGQKTFIRVRSKSIQQKLYSFLAMGDKL